MISPKYIYIRGEKGLGSNELLTEEQIQERLKENYPSEHEHWFSVDGTKKCWCGEKFDLPIVARRYFKPNGGD